MDQRVGPFRAMFIGISDVFTERREKCMLSPNDRLDGRTCLITGASSGLGKAIAIELARRGGRIIIASRTIEDKLREEIQRQGRTDTVEMLYCDLADLDSIDRVAEQIREMNVALDVVICNAGIVNLAPQPTKYGLKQMFLVNYLANVALIRKLLENGAIAVNKPGSSSNKPIPRIIFVSSESHRWVKEIRFEELGRFRPGTLRDVMPQYAEDKFLLEAFSAELARRLMPGDQVQVAVHSFCPGAVRSRIAREAPLWMKPLIALMFLLFFPSPRRAAKPAIFLSCSEHIEGQTNLYLHKMTPKPIDQRATDPQFDKKLWHYSEELLDQCRKTPAS
jgi:NAD(P)-dependent dehydrogenase (short-subunit alcohol dehydrogenase family)